MMKDLISPVACEYIRKTRVSQQLPFFLSFFVSSHGRFNHMEALEHSCSLVSICRDTINVPSESTRSNLRVTYTSPRPNFNITTRSSENNIVRYPFSIFQDLISFQGINILTMHIRTPINFWEGQPDKPTSHTFPTDSSVQWHEKNEAKSDT